jgi:uncharacterized protein
MTELVVRRLLIDLKTPLPRRWNGGDAFRTALFDALSMSFPAGEQFFIDAMKRGQAALPPEARDAFDDEVRAFIGQEATHRRVHTLFNEHLQAQGFVNHWEPRIRRRQEAMAGMGPRNWLAVTAATEHLTALFAEHLMAHPEVLAGAQPRLAQLWLWHSAEESEHRSTAFDLYRALGGNDAWRLRIFRVVTGHFLADLMRQTAHNLWRDGSLFKPSTWASGWRTLLGRDGLLRASYAGWRRYERADFHPSQGNGEPARVWLAAHAAIAPPVASTSATPA